MDYRDIQKLKAFFSAFKDSGFKPDLKQISSFTLIDGQRTPVDKAYCLGLLHELPQFQGDKFKDDNALLKYLSDPINRKFLLGSFTQEQQIELTQALEEKPVVAAGEQFSGQEGSVEQIATGEPAGTMAAGGMPQIPNFSAPSPKPPEVKTYPKPPVVETGLDYEGKPYEIPAKQAPQTEKATARAGSRFQAPRIPYAVTNAAKNFGSAAQRFIGTNLGRIGRSLGGIAGGGIGVGGRALGRFGLRAVDFGARFSNAVGSRGSALTAAGRGGGRWAMVGFLGFILLTGLLTAFAPSSPGSSPAGASPIIAADLNSCQLKRSDQSPQLAAIKNSLLAGWFKEGESMTSVPAQILAGIARLESPGFIATADNNHDALYSRNFTDLSTSCAPHFGGREGMSPTGALGLMQIQPVGTTGHFGEGVNFGASFFGKTAAQLTIADFCDPRQSIIIAAGFILKKLQLGYNIGDGTKWDPAWTNNKAVVDKVAEGFYGCLPYGGPLNTKCNDPRHLYNYGDDLWSSTQSCKITQLVASCPIAGGQIKTPSYQASPEKGHCSPSYGSCPADSRRAKSIDVDTKGQDVLFPAINGQNVNWKYITDLPLNPSDCELGTTICGRFYIFRSDIGSDYWMLHLLHLDPGSLAFDRTNAGNISGSKAGKTFSNIYLHIEIGKNIVNYSAPPSGAQDLDIGWIPADFMCK